MYLVQWKSSLLTSEIQWIYSFSFTHLVIYVSESDILGPIDYFSDIENLVSFERALFADYSFKYKMKIFWFWMI